jgi:hypothetical protein
MNEIANLAVNGIPVMVLVLALVEFAKRLGVKGKASLLLSMVLGVVLGVLAQIATKGTPIDFAGWFGIVTAGLMLGLGASGIYDFMQNRIPTMTFEVGSIDTSAISEELQAPTEKG